MSDITDVPLYQIIGAPLLALVQGETQAAQATARFIQEIGFESAYASYDLSVIENNPPDTGTNQLFVVKTGTTYSRVLIFGGTLLQSTLEEISSWDIVYGRRNYSEQEAVSIVGVRIGVAWQIYAQKQNRQSGDYRVKQVSRLSTYAKLITYSVPKLSRTFLR